MTSQSRQQTFRYRSENISTAGYSFARNPVEDEAICSSESAMKEAMLNVVPISHPQRLNHAVQSVVIVSSEWLTSLRLCLLTESESGMIHSLTSGTHRFTNKHSCLRCSMCEWVCDFDSTLASQAAPLCVIPTGTDHQATDTHRIHSIHSIL